MWCEISKPSPLLTCERAENAACCRCAVAATTRLGILAGFALEHLDSGVLHNECVGGAAAAVSIARVGAASSVLVGASILRLYCGLIVELRFSIVCCGLGRGSCGMWCALFY